MQRAPFTGGRSKGMKGLIAQADGGLFLDEIGDMPLHLQSPPAEGAGREGGDAAERRQAPGYPPDRGGGVAPRPAQS